MANIVANHMREFNRPNALYLPPEENATKSEVAVVQFKRQKVNHPTNLALEHLQDMAMDPTGWSASEKAQLCQNFFH